MVEGEPEPEQIRLFCCILFPWTGNKAFSCLRELEKGKKKPGLPREVMGCVFKMDTAQSSVN